MFGKPIHAPVTSPSRPAGPDLTVHASGSAVRRLPRAGATGVFPPFFPVRGGRSRGGPGRALRSVVVRILSVHPPGRGAPPPGPDGPPERPEGRARPRRPVAVRARP